MSELGGVGRRELVELLLSLFDDYWLRAHFIDWYPDLGPALRHDVSPRVLAWEVVQHLERRGGIDRRLFKHLLSRRPGRQQDIERVQALCLVRAHDAPPTVPIDNELLSTSLAFFSRFREVNLSNIADELIISPLSDSGKQP